MDVTVYLPDEVGRAAKAAGLNLSRILRKGVEQQLESQGLLPPAAPNLVVRRRLEFLPDDARLEAADRFWAGAPLSKLLEEYADRVPAGGKPLTRTRLAYCLRQELVESGKVARIDPADAAAIAAAFDEDGMDAAWIACRTGLTLDAARAAAANSDARRPGTGTAAFDAPSSAAELRHVKSPRWIPNGERTPNGQHDRRRNGEQ